MISSIKNEIILFGGVFSFIIALRKLVIKKRNFNDFFLFLLFFVYGLYLVSNYFIYCLPQDSPVYRTKWINILPPFALSLFSFLGPIQYAYFHSVITSGGLVPRYIIFHFLPGIIYLAVSIIFFYVNPDISLASSDYARYLAGQNVIYHIGAAVFTVAFNAYMIYFMIKIIIPLTKIHSDNRKILSIVFASIVIAIIFASFWLVEVLFSCNLIKDIRVMFSMYVILLFIISGRYPELMIVVKTEIEREKYIKTQLKGVNVKLVISKLDSFMEDKRIFAEQITLPEIAGLLDIRPHQLSEILNLYLNTTFFNYINYRRIKEAKYLLLNRPEMTIGEITYESGYNSSSSFYREFKKNTGISPLEFRNKKESLQLSAV